MRIAVLCHFPWQGGGSGAPRRTDALCRAYETAGHSVRTVSLYRPDETSRRTTADDLALSPDLVRQLDADPWPSVHLALMRLVAADPALLERFRASLEAFRPDVVQFEFPYLYEPLAPVLDTLSVRPAVVYSSHNVETAMNVAIALRESGSEERAAAIEAQLGRAEDALLAAAELVLAVSQQDAETFRRSRSEARIVVVPNGVDRRTVDEANAAHWRARLAESGVASFALFVGSEWPPNAEGFADMLGHDFSWVPEGSVIVVAGGTAADIAPRLAAGGADQAWSNSRRVVLLGRVRDVDLASLLSLADVLLLPITLGGGSNLKTAEALLSGRPVVTTSYALRGFEEFADLPMLTVADSDAEFRAAILRAWQAPAGVPGEDERSRVAALTWDHRTPAMLDAVSALVAGTNPPGDAPR